MRTVRLLLPPPQAPRPLPAGLLSDQLTHLSHSLPSTFSLQGQRPLRGSQVPRLPAGLQVQGLPKRQDRGKVSSEQPLSGDGPSSFPIPERTRWRADSRACPPPCRGSNPPTHLNRAPCAYPSTHPLTHPSIHPSIRPSTHHLTRHGSCPHRAYIPVRMGRQTDRHYTFIGAKEEYTQEEVLGVGTRRQAEGGKTSWGSGTLAEN